MRGFLAFTFLLPVCQGAGDAAGVNINLSEQPEKVSTLCSFCEYCQFCDECRKCPCERSDKTPNCHYCGYCRFCPACRLCGLCKQKGIANMVGSALDFVLKQFDRALGFSVSKENVTVPDRATIEEDVQKTELYMRKMKATQAEQEEEEQETSVADDEEEADHTHDEL
ncbi:unnamed protein product [Vitrella brassicaformis CCMP3155]|uniref:Uncharacterized protein n=1 Tax=Vitrella brassicaformis (strain CCMP3155) TaxID=1169540 RepID=A0A0G4EI66_VITBC|nr:unnamed protein product [Vitrella brassicaformis CCMP3155]|eukprot:CEL95693.1 unnamed protein product [Vitrella brassicaformis CCMP3155]